MKLPLATRIKTLSSSPTITLDNKAKTMKQQGIPVINLSAGEPDFDTPSHIIQEAQRALDDKHTKYASPQGLPKLREAIAKKLKKDNHIAYDPSQIVIGAGSKQLLYSVFQVLCNPGDEVVIPVPSWLTFTEQIKLAGGKPAFIHLKPPFKLTAREIEKALTPKTKIILLNSPSNPTSAVIDPEEIKKIAALAVKKNLWVISDEIYEKLLYDTSHLSIASINEKIKEQTITISGVSKSYAMTGWRLGYAGGPIEVIKTLTSLQSQTISNVPVFVQKAALAALTKNQSSVKTMHKEFAKRRTFLIQEFTKIKQLSFCAPEGAFYLFVSLEKVLNKTYPTAEAWCEGLLTKEHVAVVPGEAFLYPKYFRLSFAASMADLKEAVKRIKKNLN